MKKKLKRKKKLTNRKWHASTARMNGGKKTKFVVFDPFEERTPLDIARYIQSVSRGMEGMDYQKGERTLLLGEGDFAFAQCLANIIGLQKELVATNFDTELETYRKYPNAREIVGNLQSMGVEIHFEVNAKRFYREPWVAGKFDKIAFNFPHIGGGSLEETVMIMRALLKAFFKNARRCLKE